MKSMRSTSRLPRRQFLAQTTLATGALGVNALGRANAAVSAPRFEYDIERFRRVDPSLVHYERVRRFPVAKPDPRRVALGPDQRLFVAAGKWVVILDRVGVLVGSIPMSGPVLSVALAADGTLFAGVKDHVEVFDAHRRRIATWAAPKGRPLLTGLAVTEQDVFVADAGNRIVWRHDRAGQLLRRLGEKDEHRRIPGLVVPSPFFDVKAGSDGLLRVANPGRHRVETYTFDGDLEFSWGKAGVAIEAFCGCCNPCNIGLLREGRVMTFEKGLPRVKLFSDQGEFQGVVAAPVSFADPARDRAGAAGEGMNGSGGLDGVVDAAGEVYVLDLSGGDIHVFRPKAAKPA